MAMSEHFKIDHENSKTNDALIIKGENYRFSILSEILIRIEYSSTGAFEDRPTEFARNRNFEKPEFTKQEDDNYLVIETKYFKLEYTKNKPLIGSNLTPDQYFKVELKQTDKIWYFNHPEIRNFKSIEYSLDNANGNPTLKNGLYSTDGFASIDDSSSLIFNQDGTLGKRSDKRIDTYLFMYRKDFGLCLRDYFHLTGMPAMIPRYAFGVWWMKDKIYNELEVKEFVKRCEKEEIPLSVFMLNKSWHIDNGVNSGFTFNKELFPFPKKFIDELHDAKVKLCLNVNPISGIYKTEANFSQFKSDAGITEEGNIPFNLYNPHLLSSYFENIINPLIKMGTDCLWIDYNNKKDLYTQRALNHYHFKNYENTDKRGIIMSRNGLINSHLYPINYTGETVVSWNNLKMLPEYNARACNMGISFVSNDIGGFNGGIEDDELYRRFIQFGTYSPILRLSSGESHYYKREPWSWDVHTKSIVKNYLTIRHKLIPYLYSESYKYHKTGLPIVQPLYYNYPLIIDEPLYKGEYYFGTEMFVSPITNKKDETMNRTIHKMFIPDGIWYDFKTGKKFPGNKRYISFYKDEDYPVFVKSGGIIPLAKLNNLNDTDTPENLEIHIFPGQNNTYRLYEDDGISNKFKEKYYCITEIDYNYRANNYTLIIRPVEGKTGIIPEHRNYKIRFRNTRQADDVIVYIGDDLQDKVTSYVDDTDFCIEIPNVNTLKQISINCKGKDIEIDAVRLINDDIDTILSDLKIETNLKEIIASIIFNEELDIKKKRIEIRKLKRKRLSERHIKMFLKLLDYIAEF